VILRMRPTAPPEGNPAIPDVLGSLLKRSQAPESDGVRWEVALYPEALSVPGYVVLTAIFQNAYDQPRTLTLEVAPSPLLPQGHVGGTALKAGEAGILEARAEDRSAGTDRPSTAFANTRFGAG